MKSVTPIFTGNKTYAYRDPACIYARGMYNLFFTLSQKENGYMYNFVAMSQSRDLKNWSEPRILTPKDKSLNFTSPGSILKVGDEYVITVCSYPMPKPYAEYPYADDSARIYTMRTKDFVEFTYPQIIMAKADTSVAEMGRMIDAFIFEDKDEDGRYHMFFKQDGKIAVSHSDNLADWNFEGVADGGENPCVIVKDNFYYLIYSPNEDGIAFKRSCDLKTWEDMGVTTLARESWHFASGRITAGFAMEAPCHTGYRYILFFHGSVADSHPETHGEASVAFVFTDDFQNFYSDTNSLKR